MGSARKSQDLALLRPRERQIAHPLQPGSGQFRGLAAVEDGIDDVGREKRERNAPADIRPTDAMPLGQFCI